MDFVAITLFLILYYVRPHEWLTMARSLRFVAFTMVFAIVATLMRERKFTIKDVFQTPHDWLMLLYFLWIVGTGPGVSDTMGKVYNVFLYYVVTVQALYRLRRIQAFLNWWTVMILAVAFVAVLGEYGFSLNDSYDSTHGVMKGRLVLNLSIFNNPNALGHSITPVLVMLYFICFWKRPIFMKILMIPLLALPLYCIYLTQSKGAFLAGFAAVLTALIYNRPKITQGVILAFALTVGWAGMHLLPRMHELDKAQSDQAIQGRIAAFTFGRNAMHTLTTGVGYGQFEIEFNKIYKYRKAPHSSYVGVGAELGKAGLFLFLGLIYCSLRTLITCKTQNTAEERVRRLLFTLLITYIVSSWMVGFAFRATFFLMVASIAAFHRQMLWGQPAELPTPTLQDRNKDFAPAIELAGFKPAFAAHAPATMLNEITVTTPAATAASSTVGAAPTGEAPAFVPGIRWNRIGFIDVGCILAMTYATDRFWAYIMRNI